jgi:hypothetical protein
MKKFVTLVLLSIFSFTSCATRVITTTPATKVVVVKRAPTQHKVVYVKGKKYYRWNNTYYRKTKRGYVVTRF